MNFILFITIFVSFLSKIFAAHIDNTTINELQILRDHKTEILAQLNWRAKQKETVKNFYLFTRGYRDGNAYEILDLHNISSIKNSHFNSGRTYFIVHGFLGDGLESWILELKDKLLDRQDCNVVSVEWPAGTEWFLPSYHSAANRVAAVGNDTADLLQLLIDRKGLLLSNLHLIGHSLGAHICGFAGKRFVGRVAKITGLDPAGPEFRNLSKKKRLDKSDAVYVDVVHTNACTSWLFVDCYGIDEDIGHSNFWPNGGSHQPNCGSLIKELEGEIGCNHELAYAYFIESLDYEQSGTYFLARKCNSWQEFLDKNCSCGDYPQYMGINSNPLSVGRFFLQTNKYPPFAMKDSNCHFGSMNWMYVAFLCSVAFMAIVAVSGVKYSYTRMSSRYTQIYRAHNNARIPTSPNERTPLLS